MKTLKLAAIVLGLFGLLAGTTTLVRAQDYQDSYQDDGYSTGNVSLQTFYDELSPYGTWIQDPQYGYVWRPDVDQNEFRPYYSNGRWAMTEYGNTWVSNYDWGWAPFHYGRWVINSYRQWIWLPDTNWGPAWVDWRSGDGYYGWAPMAPSININLSFGRRYSVPEFCWNFIPQANIYINRFPRYDYGRNNVYIRNTTIINNTYVYNRRTYYGGPRVEDIRRATNRDVRVYRFDQSNRPGASRIDSRAVSIYRPRPERNAVDNRNAAPRKFEQGNAGFARNGRGNDNSTRGGNNTDNRFGNRNGQSDVRINGNVENRGNSNQPNTRGGVYNRDANGRGERIGQNNGQPNVDRNQDQQRVQQAQQQRAERGVQQDRMSQDQQRAQRDVQIQQQRGQQTDQQRGQFEQQRAQRDAQLQQQRSQQVDQQRAQQVQQRAAQMEQQRTQRDAQAQQQRSQQVEQQRAQQAQQRSAQMEQQRAQRDAQAQQQRAQQAQQREAQVQQQRAQQQQQRTEPRRVEAPQQQQQQNRGGERSGSEGRPSRGGRG
ncbi:hypothetical protein DHW03_08580 [Pedobacter yonginense]|uniref:Uncharacterized protein n=1 Tax=Pedobacter yonginense TaxID=651869 RepID=A0A317EM41_9SPHI|nr:DUF6600 domain-containing protein [Pedobacter yonginense]PWS27632.1 hypothetical protein DHW03_08580 [Pedobacter yonginense]